MVVHYCFRAQQHNIKYNLSNQYIVSRKIQYDKHVQILMEQTIGVTKQLNHSNLRLRCVTQYNILDDNHSKKLAPYS